MVQLMPQGGGAPTGGMAGEGSYLLSRSALLLSTVFCCILSSILPVFCFFLRIPYSAHQNEMYRIHYRISWYSVHKKSAPYSWPYSTYFVCRKKTTEYGQEYGEYTAPLLA